MITCRLTLLLHPELDPLSVDNFVNFVHILCQFHCFACKSACMIVPSGAPATMVGLGSTAQTSISPATPALARMGEDAIRLEPTDTSVTVHQVRNGFKDPKKVYWIQILCVCVSLPPTEPSWVPSVGLPMPVIAFSTFPLARLWPLSSKGCAVEADKPGLGNLVLALSLHLPLVLHP